MSEPITKKYYPSLSTVVTLDDFPDNLGFIKEGIKGIFEKIYIKDFQANISPRGESGFYGLSIVSKERLQFKIPGTEILFVLNPDKDDASISSFPVTVEYQWLVLSYLRSFDLQNFSFSARDFFELGLQILNVSEEEVISLVINNFVAPSNDSLTKVEQFVNDLNNEFGLAIPVPSSDNKPRELVLAIKNQFSNEASIAAFLLYFLDVSNLENSLNNVKNFFKALIPEDIESYIKNIITPKARVTLALSAAIEFPHSILKPVLGDGSPHPDPEAKSQFKFAQALLYADTQEGFGYQVELGGSLSPDYATIANTGLILQIDSLKLDLSKKTNIAEADADGRPNDFVGVYARALSVTLPSRWFHDEALQGSPSTTLRLGGYDMLIGTGGVSGTFMLETVPVLVVGGSVYYFDNKFDISFPVTLLQKNEDTLEVEEIEVVDLDDLKLKLFPTTSTEDIPPYSFKFPISVTEKAPLTGGTKTFKSASEYQLYLSSFPNDNGVDAVPTLWKTIGSADKGFRVGFNKFDITLKQNKVVGSNIKGALEINKFKNNEGNPFHADIEGHLYDNGDFNLSASFSEANAPEATLLDLVKFKFNSLELGKEDDDYYLGTSCEISFPSGLMDELTKGQSFIIEKLRIYSDGTIALADGGAVTLPLNLSLDLKVVKMGVTNITFGSTQIKKDGQMRKYNFWGFDGAISINPLGLDARGEGIKFYYTVDDNDGPGVVAPDLRKHDSFLHIQTIEVDLIIPAPPKDSAGLMGPAEDPMAIIHGMISLPAPGVSQEFVGEVDLKLPRANISGGVGMRFMPKYPAFLIDAHIELPTPIPLGFISITAFRGLLGFRYVATKKAAGLTTDNSWYEFYKKPKSGINIRKFSGPPDSMQYKTPFSIGAGATFVTTADGGFILSLRAMLLLSLPTLFYIEAGLNVVAGKLGLIEDDPSNPPFFAMVAFGDDSLELAAGADFSIPKDSGAIFQLHALLEAGFFFKNQKPWYVNIGSKKDPITARILSLLTAKSFIMLSAQGIEAGARLDFNLQQKFGPAKVRLWAYMEMGGKISFKRPQMGGYMTAGGGIQIKIWIVDVEITLDTIFSIESFKPFLIYAKLDLRVYVRIFRKKIHKNFTIEIQWDISRIMDRTPYSPLPKGTFGDGLDDRTSESVKGVHMLTNQAFALDYFKCMGEVDYDPSRFHEGEPLAIAITEIIPLDTYIDIKTAKGLLPNPELAQKIGGFTSGAKNYVDIMPPVGTAGGRKLRQVKHEYSITKIELKSWVPENTAVTPPIEGHWEDYHPFEAVVAFDERTEELKKLPWAYWQKAIDQYDSIRVLATNPFSFLSAGEPGWHVPEQYGITPSKLFCVSEKIKKEHTDFLNKNIGERYYVPTQYEADKINGLYFKLVGEIPAIVGNKLVGGDFMSITGEKNPFDYNRSLSFKNYNQLEIIFPESAIEPTLNLTTYAKEVKIQAYTAVILPNDKLVTYEEISQFTKIYQKSELVNHVKLTDIEVDPSLKTPIDKIVITPIPANAERISEIRNEIAVLIDTIYANEEEEDVETAMDALIISQDYIDLLEELEELKTAAGNENVDLDGPFDQLTFTRYYGYNGNTAYAFDSILKYNDTYLISFHPQENTTAIVQIDANGKLVRERLLNGVVTSMQVVNGNLVLTQALDVSQCKGIGLAIIDDDFVVGCQGSEATTAIVELDPELNSIFGIQYPNTYSLAYNKLFPLANNEMLWINTLVNETQINWIDGSDRSVLNRVTVDEVAIKVLQHNATQFSLITKDKKIIPFSIDAVAKTVSIVDAKEISDATITEITDAVIANNKIVIGVKMANGKFGLAQIDGTTVEVVKNDTIFNTALYLSNQTLGDNSIIAYNKKHLFLFNDALVLTRLIDRNNGVEEASIIDIQNEPSANEILMLSTKANEKGVYFSLFNDQFDNCSLHLPTTPTVSSSSSTLTSFTANIAELNNATTLGYRKRIKYSNLITVNDVICSSGGDSEEDEEVDYTTYIQKVCWSSRENDLYNSTIPGSAAVAVDKAAMVAGVQKTVQPIWRPNTTYYLHFTLQDKVDKNAKEFEYYYGFKTKGPLGHYPIPEPTKQLDDMKNLPDNGLGDLSRSPLASLRQYLDYRRSYPNADGSLLQAKPVYYGNSQCKLSLYFTNPYVYHMFTNWDVYGDRLLIKGALNLSIKDPLNDVIIDYPLTISETPYSFPTPNEVGEGLGWTDDNDPRIPVGIQLLNNLITKIKEEQADPLVFSTIDNPIVRCDLNIGGPLKPKSYGYAVELTNLKPSKLYTLLVNNYYELNDDAADPYVENALVHQFGFQTSRYKNFEEHVNSYEMGEKDETGNVIVPKKALFDVNVDLDQDRINALYAVITGVSNPLSDSIALKYQDSFDRAIEGILQLSPLDPAQGTEINKIRNSTGELIAILIRNPEPFNIPKIPLEEIKDTISVGDITLEVFTKNPEYKVLHSKDYSQVLIMNDSKNITTTNLGFKFEYRMWNNESIADIETGLVPLTVFVQQVSLQVEL